MSDWTNSMGSLGYGFALHSPASEYGRSTTSSNLATSSASLPAPDTSDAALEERTYAHELALVRLSFLPGLDVDASYVADGGLTQDDGCVVCMFQTEAGACQRERIATSHVRSTDGSAGTSTV